MAVTARPSSVNGKRLGAFIAASIAVHCLLLAGWFHDDIVPGRSSMLAVTMLLPEQITATPKQTVVELQGRQSTPNDSPVQHKTTVAKKDNAATINTPPVAGAPRQTPPPHKNETAQQIARNKPAEQRLSTNTETAVTPIFTLGQTKERLSEQLHNDLARHFHYPRLALLRGWQGTVLLDLRIEIDGRISRISLAHSSGYSLLDNSAIETLHRVGSVREAARWLQNESLELQLPVSYRLAAM